MQFPAARPSFRSKIRTKKSAGQLQNSLINPTAADLDFDASYPDDTLMARPCICVLLISVRTISGKSSLEQFQRSGMAPETGPETLTTPR